MYKNKHYKQLQDNITAFNKLTTNKDCSLAIKYLQEFKWDVEVSSLFLVNLFYSETMLGVSYSLRLPLCINHNTLS